MKRAARERVENIRWRSTAKTLERRLQSAASESDKARAIEAQAELIRWLDKAAARGAIHPNRAARKKAQAARLVADSGS